MEDKISFYNIEVNHNGNILLYNSLEDSLVYLEKEEYEVINSLLNDLQRFNQEYPALYEEFKKAGFIVPNNYNELDYIKFQNKRLIFANSDYHITINPTLECNLRCWYCSVKYAKEDFNEGMSLTVVNNVNAHIQNVILEQKATSLHLDWFGGEPLMYFDQVIDPISANANELVKKNNVKFTQHITTNATLMNTARIQRMKELNFTSFQIPIDGNEQRHNKIKSYSNKQGTYRDVINNINMIAETIPNVCIVLRINYDKQTLKKIQDVIKDIEEKNKCRIHVDFQKVWQVSYTEKEMNLLKEAKEIFRMNGLDSDFWAYQPRKFYSCYSDKYRQYAINYNGKVFKCTAHDYGDDKVIGILLPDGRIDWNDDLLSSLFSVSTFENRQCMTCKKLPVCMGPCIQKNHNSRVNNTPLPCVFDCAQYPFDLFVIEEAKKRNLIN